MRSAMRIGEVAHRSGFTVKALRFYHRHGPLTPSGRSLDGYRLYDVVALQRLEFIRQAKALGLALADIGHLVGSTQEPGRGKTRARLLQLLEQRISDTTRQISTLLGLKEKLARRRHELRRRRARPRGPCTCLERRGDANAVRQLVPEPGPALRAARGRAGNDG